MVTAQGQWVCSSIQLRASEASQQPSASERPWIWAGRTQDAHGQSEQQEKTDCSPGQCGLAGWAASHTQGTGPVLSSIPIGGVQDQCFALT